MNASNLKPAKSSSLAVLCVLSFAGLTVVHRPASAEQPNAPAQPTLARIALLPVPDVEKAFWICDHTAATRGVNAAPVEFCSAVYTSLRDRKFGGDFNELLTWWTQNKQIQHSALSAGM